MAGTDAGKIRTDGAFRRSPEVTPADVRRRQTRVFGRNLLEKALIPLLAALATFLTALICIAVYQLGVGAEVLTIAIGNWMTALAICILVLLGVLAVLSDVNAP